MPDGNSPLNMGAPWDAISQPAGGDQIPEMENLRTGLQRAMQPAQLAGTEETARAMKNLEQFEATMAAHSAAAARPPQATETTTKVKPDGTKEVSIKGPAELAEYYQNAGQFYQQALGGFAKQMSQMDQQLAAQEQAARNQPPWVQLATALSANLAQQKDMPGWVRGLGQTAAELNPRPDQIRNQRLAVLNQEAQLAEKSAGLGIAHQRTILEDQREQRLLASTEAGRAAKTFQELGQAAQKGELTDEATTSQVLQDSGKPKAQADTQAKALVGISREKKSLLDAAAAATDARSAAHLKEMARESDNRLAVMLKGLSVKASDKADSDKALEETAQALAPMNKDSLNAMTQVAGMFGSARNKIFARARELNPHFNTAEISRMMDMEKSFTSGKDSLNVQSFDTFLQHAGELHDSIDQLYQSKSPALNKPMNWIRKNAEGNPEYQKLLVAIEPVGKEFESFLLNQRALYVDDRKQIETLLNGNSSPAQIKAALSQMGKTAKDRFGAMNQRYKRVMGQDIENAFSPESIDAAKKIGLSLPQAKATETPKGKYYDVATGKWVEQ